MDESRTVLPASYVYARAAANWVLLLYIRRWSAAGVIWRLTVWASWLILSHMVNVLERLDHTFIGLAGSKAAEARRNGR
jgi:hypothetical protein